VMAPSDNLDDGHGRGSPWSSTSLQVATLFLIVLAVVGIAIAIFHHGSHHARAGNPPATSHAGALPATTTTSAAVAGPCSLPAGDQQVPSASYPQGVTWQAVGTMTAPQSPTLGPQHVKNGINICFAHNPSGALLAACNLWAEGTTDISERQVFDQLAIDVPSSVSTEPAVNDNPQAGGIQVAGYKYDSYSPTEAMLEIVLRHDQGGLSAVQTPMRWTGNDWKYVFPPEGPISASLNGAQVQPPYVAWSAFS
jgi:hypothetical protein